MLKFLWLYFGWGVCKGCVLMATDSSPWFIKLLQSIGDAWISPREGGTSEFANPAT